MGYFFLNTLAILTILGSGGGGGGGEQGGGAGRGREEKEGSVERKEMGSSG